MSNSVTPILKKKGQEPKKRRINWNQSLQTRSTVAKGTERVRKSLQYRLLVKKFENQIDYKNIKLLQAFLTPYGRILPRRKTRLSVQEHRAISKAIRKARAFGLIPFTCDVKTN